MTNVFKVGSTEYKDAASACDAACTDVITEDPTIIKDSCVDDCKKAFETEAKDKFEMAGVTVNKTVGKTEEKKTEEKKTEGSSTALKTYKENIEAARTAKETQRVKEQLEALLKDENAIKNASADEKKEMLKYFEDYKKVAPEAVKDNVAKVIAKLEEGGGGKGNTVFHAGGRIGWGLGTVWSKHVYTDLKNSNPPQYTSDFHFMDDSGWGWQWKNLKGFVDLYFPAGENGYVRVSPGFGFDKTGYKVHSDNDRGGPSINETVLQGLIEVAYIHKLSDDGLWAAGGGARVGGGARFTNVASDQCKADNAYKTCYDNIGDANSFSNLEELDGTNFNLLYQALGILDIGPVELMLAIGGETTFVSKGDRKFVYKGENHYLKPDDTTKLKAELDILLDVAAIINKIRTGNWR